MFDVDRFVADCRDALQEDASHKGVREVVARAVADPAAVLAAVGEPTRGGVFTLYRSPELTVLNIVWAPRMTLMPHNHTMWAVIGMYTGREDNIFWKRRAEGGLTAGGAKALFPGDVTSMPADVIHSVNNPLPRFAGGIHIYGGDFFNTERSLWNAETLAEEPSNGEIVRAMFARENERLRRRV